MTPLAPTATPSTPRSRTPDVRVVRYGDDRLTGITTIDVVVPDLDAHAEASVRDHVGAIGARIRAVNPSR